MTAIETLYPDRLTEQVEHLAHHAFRGEVWDKAVVYLRQAGAKAAARSAHREAVAYGEQALEAAGHRQDSRAALEEAIDIRCDLRNSLLLLGQLPHWLDHLRVAESLAASLGDERRLGWVSVHMLMCLEGIGDSRRVVELGERTLGIGVSLGDLAMQVHSRHRLAHASYSLGSYRQAVEWARGNIAALGGLPAQESFGMAGPPLVLSMGFLTAALAELGELAEGAAVIDEGIQLAEDAGYPFSRISAAMFAGHLHLRKGDFTRAIPLLEGALRIAETFEIPVLIPSIVSYLGCAYALNGRVDDSIGLLEAGIEQGAALERHWQHTPRVTNLGEAYLLAGRPAEAQRLAEQALAISRDRHERGAEAWALRLLGEIAAHADPPDVEQAEARYREALTLAQELGMRPLVAHCHLGLGTLYQKIGRDEQAHAELAMAAEMYGAMEMRFWLARAEAVLAQVVR